MIKHRLSRTIIILWSSWHSLCNIMCGMRGLWSGAGKGKGEGEGEDGGGRGRKEGCMRSPEHTYIYIHISIHIYIYVCTYFQIAVTQHTTECNPSLMKT